MAEAKGTPLSAGGKVATIFERVEREDRSELEKCRKDLFWNTGLGAVSFHEKARDPSTSDQDLESALESALFARRNVRPHFGGWPFPHESAQEFRARQVIGYLQDCRVIVADKWATESRRRDAAKQIDSLWRTLTRRDPLAAARQVFADWLMAEAGRKSGDFRLPLLSMAGFPEIEARLWAVADDKLERLVGAWRSDGKGRSSVKWSLTIQVWEEVSGERVGAEAFRRQKQRARKKKNG